MANITFELQIDKNLPYFKKFYFDSVSQTLVVRSINVLMKMIFDALERDEFSNYRDTYLHSSCLATTFSIVQSQNRVQVNSSTSLVSKHVRVANNFVYSIGDFNHRVAMLAYHSKKAHPSGGIQFIAYDQINLLEHIRVVATEAWILGVLKKPLEDAPDFLVHFDTMCNAFYNATREIMRRNYPNLYADTNYTDNYVFTQVRNKNFSIADRFMNYTKIPFDMIRCTGTYSLNKLPTPRTLVSTQLDNVYCQIEGALSENYSFIVSDNILRDNSLLAHHIEQLIINR